MIVKKISGFVFAVLIVGCITANAEITLPKILGNDMVLQQGKPVPIWGTASPSEHVSVNFNKLTKETTADASGHWMIMLDAMQVSATPLAMTITGSNTIKLNNILIGEVWLCSGQSNMEYSMRKNSKVVKTEADSLDKNSPIDELQYAKNPAIRIFLVTSKNLQKPDPTHTGWSIAKDSALRSFSAAGYFFGKKLYEKLHVPIGVISSAVPGSAIEPWLTGTITNEKELAVTQPKLKMDETTPGKFIPNMVRPLVPFAIKGFLWYQGETNCFQNESLEYTYKMEALISEWRNLWNDKNLPFYYVQIAPFFYSKSAGKYPLTTETLPRFWEAQILALSIPNTAMAVTTDLNNTPDELHPAFKWEVGRRLALIALAKIYGQKIAYSGPTYKQMKIEKGRIEIEFSNAGIGLMNKDGKPLTEFTIAGKDGNYVPAEAVIEGNKVIVSSKDVPSPANVRFEWTEVGHANLYNKEGLPAVPFRTDNPNHFVVSK
jgi:sialate O-acetylesterase